MKAPIKKKKSITLDDLALMTQQGFQEVHTEIGELRARVDERFEKVDVRLDRIEHLLIGGHDRRLDKIEDDMRVFLSQQRGFRSRGFRGAYLSAQEKRVGRYHELIDDYIEDRLPKK